MATKDETLHLINAATKQELKLIEKTQFYRVNGDVVIGDLYRDPINPHVAVVLVIRKTTLKDIEDTMISTTPGTEGLDLASLKKRG